MCYKHTYFSIPVNSTFHFSFLYSLHVKLNECETAAAVFCKLLKAFDCVFIGILLCNLEVYGFKNSVLSWFWSYLSERHQTVFLNWTKSNDCIIDCAVPQGSVLRRVFCGFCILMMWHTTILVVMVPR